MPTVGIMLGTESGVIDTVQLEFLDIAATLVPAGIGKSGLSRLLNLMVNLAVVGLVGINGNVLLHELSHIQILGLVELNKRTACALTVAVSVC
jgi:ABC-type phosphate transport system ATPase subunit